MEFDFLNQLLGPDSAFMADTASTYGTSPGSQQTQMLAEQDFALEKNLTGVPGASSGFDFQGIAGSFKKAAGQAQTEAKKDTPLKPQVGQPKIAAAQQGAAFQLPTGAQPVPTSPAMQTIQGFGAQQPMLMQQPRMPQMNPMQTMGQINPLFRR